jgi:hypothetical protein
MTGILQDQEARALAHRVMYGTEDDSARAIQELGNTIAQRAHGGGSQVAPQLIVQEAARQAVAQMAFQNNLERVGSEHTDIFNDRGLTILAADEVGNIRQKYAALGQQAPPDLEIYREACKAVRQRYGHGHEAPSQTSAMSGATLSNRPESASKKMSGDPTSSNPAEFSDVTDDPVENSLRNHRGETVRKMAEERRVGVHRGY